MDRADEISESDDYWNKQRVENGWTIQKPSPALFRLPIIRWFRFAVASFRVHRHASQWASVGIGIGGPNEYDKWVLWAIYRGWA